MSVSVPRPAPAAADAFSRSLRWRNSEISRARPSSSTATKFSPAVGHARQAEDLHRQATARPPSPGGPCRRASRAPGPIRRRPPRCRPAAACPSAPARSPPGRGRGRACSRSRCPRRRGPGWPSGPAPRPAAVIASSSLSRLIFWVAETSISCVSPPRLSTTISCCSSSCFTRSGLTPGLSILLIGDDQRHVRPPWRGWIASIVCGITPSSAATTSTTMSVTLAPRARMAVKAAWPGVSMKVTRSPDPAPAPGRRRCAG